MADILIEINDAVSALVWGPAGIGLLLVTGLWLTVRLGAFQLVRLRLWLKNTLGAILCDGRVMAGGADGSISPFQSLCTALAATIGTGSIVGVASAVMLGGPGAVFWMWVMAFFGMMTSYAENLLGLRYRRRRPGGGWQGGPMYYLADGLGAKPGCGGLGRALAAAFALFCTLASFGIGNLSQVNAIAGTMQAAFGLPAPWVGLALAAATGWLLWHGLKGIAAAAELLVPFMAVFYLVGALLVVLTNLPALPAALRAIFKGAFGLPAAGGGAVGYGLAAAVRWGFMRGSFSSEAGFGSSAIVNAAADTDEPARQGMWGIFQVFVSTFLVCTLTALALLTAGLVDPDSGRMRTAASADALAGEAFSAAFGAFGPVFVAVAVLLFAWSSVIGWSQCGAESWAWLFGRRSVGLYKLLFVLLILVGANVELELAWAVSDTFNGLMMLPNLVGLLALSGEAAEQTRRFLAKTGR